MRLVVDLAWRFHYTNELIYVHCWVSKECYKAFKLININVKGGHGRTGTVIGTLIGKKKIKK